jgi:SH3-like domain-containing protein
MKLFMGTLLIFFMCGVSSAGTVSVAVQSADLRSAPSVTESMVVLQIPENYPLTILEDKEDFYFVSDFAGRTGWIHKSNISESKGVVVAGEIANLRKGPGMEHEIVCKAEKGVAFKVIGSQENWLEVVDESNNKGWMYKSLVWGL